MNNTIKKLQLLFVIPIMLQSCAEPADKFFGVAILNTNTITDFATPVLAKHISDEAAEFPNIPSSKKKGDESLKYVENQILYMEKSLKDIQALSENGDNRKEIKAQAISLYEFVIPVYKNEYSAYAKLCDAKGSTASKEEIINTISKKYSTEFEKRYTLLLSSGKAFAKSNNLNVSF